MSNGQDTAAAPLVSVLLPAYNHARYIKAAVDSVLAQTCNDFELIAIDDCSTDETLAKLQEYGDRRLHVHHHTSNQGSHATLNEALSLARGKFIAIINSDDIFTPDRLSACLAEIESSHADMIGTDIVLIDDEDRMVAEHWWIDAFAALKYVWHETHDWPATLLEGNIFMTTSNFFFRRRWLEAVGGFNDLRYVLDYEWLLRGLGQGLQLAWLDRPLLRYRLHESNTISERPLAANLECAGMLRTIVPALLGGNTSLRLRLDHLVAQWARIEKYLGEIGSTQRHEALVAKENELLPLIADRDRWVAERDQWIAERDEHINRQKQWIAERDHWIAERDQWITERDEAIVANLRDLTACRNELTAIRSSRSYRLGRALTAPARWLFRNLPRRSRH
jgi:glycosyltransferase involved in cell wall biosynthesis